MKFHRKINNLALIIILFFSFYRAMQAYETALIGGDTSLILSPDSDFFKFFGDTGIIKKE